MIFSAKIPNSLRLVTSISMILLIAGCDSAQTGKDETNKPAEGKTPTMALQPGPVDKLEQVAPGKIDEDASPKFEETASGLRYRTLRKSEEKRPTASNTVTVHYKGWTDDGKIFDSSYRRNETISFPLNRVVKGWTEGLQLVGTGGMIELEIPYPLGYGERGMPPDIPPRATLHFIVELFSIK